MPVKDREKQREYNRRWYEKHAEAHKDRARERKQRLRREYYAYKATKHCLHCGEADIVCLEFHHIDPATKDVDPSQMVESKSWPMKRLIDYLEKTCIVLCSNCHKKVHRDLRKIEKTRNEPTPHPAAG